MPFSGNRADTARRSLAGSSPTIVVFFLRDPKADDDAYGRRKIDPQD